MGFCVASTKNGSSRAYFSPATVTWCSCIASSSAACVLGGVRLISSARMTLAKRGPLTNCIRRRPSPVSSRISVPVMSAGIKSGVNWIRWNFRWKTCAIVRTSKVFASPGAPRSVCHGVGHDVDAHRVGLLLRELVEVVDVFALAFPAVAEVGVVADDRHHPVLVVEDAPVMDFLRVAAMPSLPGHARVFPG